MLPIKNILCPTDFSDPSYEALKASDELAAHFGATLHIINVVPLVPIVEAPIGVESASFNVASGDGAVSAPAGTLGRIGIPKAGKTITRITVNGRLAWDGDFHPVPGLGSRRSSWRAAS